MRVFVKNMRGEPLMPTNPRKARVLLKQKKAKVISRTPFAIQLLYATGEATQKITLGVDAGNRKVGISATTKKEELYAAEAELRNNIVDLLTEKRQYRRTRRNRLRYRPARFNNRRINEGWLAPSIRHKIESHLKLVRNVCEILPISKIVVEIASFDIRKINNAEKNEGEKELGFWNNREYVFFRDAFKCQGKRGCKNKILNVHHISKTGGNAPDNLVTLCEECHDAYHKDALKLKHDVVKEVKVSAFTRIVPRIVYNRLKGIYPDVELTYGYITKYNRINGGILKKGAADAYCIAGNLRAARTDTIYKQKFVRKGNRGLYKANLKKGGKRESCNLPYIMYGFRMYDKVLFDNQECFIIGRRSNGSFALGSIDGEMISGGRTYKKLTLLEYAGTLLSFRLSNN